MLVLQFLIIRNLNNAIKKTLVMHIPMHAPPFPDDWARLSLSRFRYFYSTSAGSDGKSSTAQECLTGQRNLS